MWSYNETIPSDELYHYGVKGMKWGKRKQKYADDFNKNSSSLGKLYNKVTGADKIYADIMTSQSKRRIQKTIKTGKSSSVQRSSNKNSKSVSKPKTNSNGHKTNSKTNSNGNKTNSKTINTGKNNVKKVVKNNSKTIKDSEKEINTGMSVLNTLYRNPMAESAKQTTDYLTMVSQLSPEYRRRYVYNL